MGRWLAGCLTAQGQQAVLLDRNGAVLAEIGQKLGVEVSVDPGIASGAEVLVLAVPISCFEEAVQALTPFTHAGQTVIDITSVKTTPVGIMHRYLPHCTVLGTHPVFGPGTDGLDGQNIVLTPTSAAEQAAADRLAAVLCGYGAHVVQMTPERHDELMAGVLGLAHYIALVSGDTLLSMENFAELAQVGGPTFRALLSLVKSVLDEDPTLYSAIQMQLPALPGLEQVFAEKAKAWAELVAGNDFSGFRDRMLALSQRFSEQSQLSSPSAA